MLGWGCGSEREGLVYRATTEMHRTFLMIIISKEDIEMRHDVLA